MIVETLICRMDGTQELVQQELPDDFFQGSPPSDAEQPEASAQSAE